MPYAGVTVFILFFGLALLDALRDGQWFRALLWIAAGAAFWLLERRGRLARARRRGAGSP